MVLKVCVGSSCHLRGSYDVIEEMKRLIKEHGMEGKIDLQASFCMGNCQNGVSLKAGRSACAQREQGQLRRAVPDAGAAEGEIRKGLAQTSPS